MSGYKIHVLVYVVCFSLASYVVTENRLLEVSSQTLVLSFFIGALYSILPDLDMPASLMRRLVERFLLFLLLVLIAGYVFLADMMLIFLSIAVVVFLLVLWFAKHRGFFHTVAAGLISSMPLLLVEPYFAFSALLGFLVHLLVDGKLFALI